MAEENEQGEQGDKTEEPSTYRIEQFRKRGEVASSKELTSILLLLGSVMVLGLSVTFILETITEYLRYLVSLDAEQAYTEQVRKVVIEKGVWTAVKCCGPAFLTSFSIGIISNLMQVGFLYAPEVITFKPERLNPVTNFKKILSIRALLEAVKGIIKFSVVIGLSCWFLRDEIKQYAGFLHLDFLAFFLTAKWMIIKLALAIIIGLFAMAIGDFAYQKWSYHRKLMLTKQEAKREHREQEGSPEVKQRIKTIQRSIAQRRMMQEVPKADVVVNNPTHISVALKYDPQTMVSPQVIAKGADHLAFKIREIAKQYDIPMVENVPLARALYKTVKIGRSIPRELYKAVAEVLAVVYKLKKRSQEFLRRTSNA